MKKSIFATSVAMFMVMFIGFVKSTLLPDEFVNNQAMALICLAGGVGSAGLVFLSKNVGLRFAGFVALTNLVGFISTMITIGDAEPTFDRAVITMLIVGIANAIEPHLDKETI